MQVNAADGEYGVKFTASGNEPTCWFRVDELVAAVKPNDAPNIVLHSERTIGPQPTQSPVPGVDVA